MTIQTIIILMCIGLTAGVLSGLIGIGGGIIMVPLLLLMGFTQQQAQGTSLAALLPPVTFLAVLNYHKAGFIDWRFAIIISIVFVVGGYFGSKMAINIDQKILKKVFAVILLFIGGFLLFEKA
ncbi:sulfite exporter TauE/SafE family protein [Flavobacterium sp. PL11]|uniref:sulfite exporter TauE/SafE family protein n=1 Tax=Flavobacterium sp. PL11 TaxID=3071717 RepID=UPI002E14F255